ncbi:DUF6173 family protein [Fictibacillus iocasae]|uniref:DUF6173 family protein n=1 Tax=Fictibacillus iocasae TaxID=2715437 RepID=A0ABW2NSC8_9BACL
METKINLEDYKMPAEVKHPVEALPKDTSNPNLASDFHKALMNMINEFDSQLDHDHEVGMKLVSFGKTIQFHVSQIGYVNPSLITFAGFTPEENPVKLIQHVSQLSFLLMEVKRLKPDEPKKRIGFTIEG